MKYAIEFYLDIDGLHRVRIVAPNGRIIFNGGQGYSRRIDVRRTFHNFAKALQEGRIEERS